MAELGQYLELKRKIQPETCEEFGYDWEGAQVNQISTDNFSSCKEIQMELHKPFCVIALTIDQAKEFLEQQLAAIREVDPNYILADQPSQHFKSASSLPS
ncbi:hypothetical protein HLH17_09330 [Acinetobacter sp. ANC 5380]|uniref:Uncharacterized protein n=1 Tax=Acinetobacter terrae TaxID=2731247 RepID=A0A7Y2RFR1_9GAMM|nr:hypothetical protein [Acinetobacter terrae]NNH77858.1 hypothetical protein [Acinetobacter terrae]